MSEGFTLHALIHGRVQGVGFRWFTRDTAERLGIGGWVRNRPDGAVEVEASGDRAVLDTFLAHLKVGPRASRVDSVETAWLDEPREHRGFFIR